MNIVSTLKKICPVDNIFVTIFLSCFCFLFIRVLKFHWVKSKSTIKISLGLYQSTIRPEILTNQRWKSDLKYWLISAENQTWNIDKSTLKIRAEMLTNQRWKSDLKYWIISAENQTWNID